MVVERDPVIGLKDAAQRDPRKLLDQAPELIAPRSDPAAEESLALAGWQVDAREWVAGENVSRIERDERFAVVPCTDQRDEPFATAEQAQDVEWREREVEPPTCRLSPRWSRL
ncbi:MAG: hypothetical protein ABIN55_08315 [Aeromicrobium sp.]